jgi:hypothetical protein
MDRWNLPSAQRLETAEMRRDRLAEVEAIFGDAVAMLVEHLGRNQAAVIIAKHQGRLRRGRGQTKKKDTIAHYDVELMRLYQRVRGRWKMLPDRSWAANYQLARIMRLSKVKNVSSLPREIANRLGEEHWHPDLRKIFGGNQPAIFTSCSTESVERHIRSIVARYKRVEQGYRMVWPPWPPSTADK